ncbi:rhomboid family intramembrane serine protease [Flavobacteriaceae bacterium]|jgi:membrane associated rhomboid family serine protease|nr:rhomboid family intramembrane serine protease [Flavobacteriaceae bacterium]MDC3318343.1 rhomboid family intramembrane serine protease [Flavobacteriaceae bacterium]
MSLINDLKSKFIAASIIQQLIYVNIAVFIITLILSSFSGLYGNKTNFIYEWFSLSSSFEEMLIKPWSLVSYGFLHHGFLHILFNCLVLHFFGRLFLEYFSEKQALNFYILGTLFGGIAYLLSYSYFPLFEGKVHTMVGASAGITAIVIGIATYIPNYQLQLRFIGYVKVWQLAGVFIVFDLISLAGGNGGGHIAHLGGALFGYIYVSKASNKKISFSSWFYELFSKRKNPLQTVYKSTKRKNTNKSTDNKQAKIDSILDKISKTGYETLTKEEKEFLFKQSN